MSKESELKQIEDKLSIYLSSDRRNWADTFKLTKRVCDEELYSGEYADYGDFFWLCISKELLEVAQKYVAKGWSILLVDEHENITVARKAEKRECLFRQETLTEAVIHS